MMDVLYCILNDSPEALNMMQEEHIKVRLVKPEDLLLIFVSRMKSSVRKTVDGQIFRKQRILGLNLVMRVIFSVFRP